MLIQLPCVCFPLTWHSGTGGLGAPLILKLIGEANKTEHEETPHDAGPTEHRKIPWGITGESQ